MVQIPVYAFTGFLDSGKTKFIQETLEDERFNAGERTLLLVFEEGEEEYDFSTYPHQNVYLEVRKKNVMSVDIPVLEYKTRTADANDIYSYGFAYTSADLDDAVKSLADVLPDMLKLAETEKACQLMAAEIEKAKQKKMKIRYFMEDCMEVK